MKVTLVQQSENPIEKIANIASICYGKDDAKYLKRLVKNLLKLKHESVFEHIYFTWRIEGVSRALLGQLTRHRHSSPTVRSQRYCDESERKFVIPKSILDSDGALLIWTHITREIKSAYEQLLKRGIPREDARFILPQATETDLFFTCNLRELLHIYRLRNDKSAQWEIRKLINMMVDTIDWDLQFMFAGLEIGSRVKIKAIVDEWDNSYLSVDDYIGQVGTITDIEDWGDCFKYLVELDNGELPENELMFIEEELELTMMS